MQICLILIKKKNSPRNLRRLSSSFYYIKNYLAVRNSLLVYPRKTSADGRELCSRNLENLFRNLGKVSRRSTGDLHRSLKSWLKPGNRRNQAGFRQPKSAKHLQRFEKSVQKPGKYARKYEMNMGTLLLRKGVPE